MKEPAKTIRNMLEHYGHLRGSALDTAVREWSETNCTWSVFVRSVRAGLVYPGADNDVLCPPIESNGSARKNYRRAR